METSTIDTHSSVSSAGHGSKEHDQQNDPDSRLDPSDTHDTSQLDEKISTIDITSSGSDIVFPDGHFYPPDIRLVGEEKSDSKSFMKRYPVLSVLRSSGFRPDSDGKSSLLKSDQEFLFKNDSKFLFEPAETIVHRSKLSYFNSSIPYDLLNLCQLQRLVYSNFRCHYGETALYSLCVNKCSGCLKAMRTTDAGHGRLAAHADAGLSINIGRVVKL